MGRRLGLTLRASRPTSSGGSRNAKPPDQEAPLSDDYSDYHSGCEDCFCCPDGCASGRCLTDSVGGSVCPCTCD